MTSWTNMQREAVVEAREDEYEVETASVFEVNEPEIVELD